VKAMSRIKALVSGGAFLLAIAGCTSAPRQPTDGSDHGSAGTAPVYADSHFHTSNYAYQGISLKQLIDDYMGDRIVRSVVMPVPLQQRWDGFENYASGRIAPNYYLGPKADLYYYAFADAMYAKEYLALSQKDQRRIDLMITGFNPMDRYAVLHVKRALLTFPGAFVGIGEFTVHKEIVSKKIAGEKIADTSASGLPEDVDADGKLSLYNPALKDILDLLAETGLVGTLHNDMYPARVKYDGTVEALEPNRHFEPALRALCARNSRATVIWAHSGLGRFVKPAKDHVAIVSRVLDACPSWYVDLSWDLAQRWMVNPGPDMPSSQEWVAFIAKYQDRLLWGSDTVAYSRNVVDGQGQVQAKGRRVSCGEYDAVPQIMEPLLRQVSPAVATKVRVGNYVRLFDRARERVRAWEARHQSDDVWNLGPSVEQR
jgi:hypothetical protein